MSFFLFIKQFVDMLYPYKILDYGMVILVIFITGIPDCPGQTGFFGTISVLQMPLC